ncbi:hypothetical protein FH593_20475 (plasmid) [Leptospira interrogans]|uniref:hypothetical protein n=1 Tax=Leptospira interrogans TaxID=173 RepID=UPI0002BFE32C|nr:hypothetical protein [Leptospira interrogans]EMN60294.1 hypothetical protein LEP1GSC092_0052 [Leptospira interrogans serovar Pyrogenes str. R168]ULG90675.1 hypothetical protein FH593_20770 [Leptospira interrogans]ULG90704.1 hypothetical protein FH593_20475 [Leptospira interrogans]UML78396.1 hypothetical protein FH583_21620 [Leptospira interrogans]UML78452.1 hypothetical protein FH583_21470 [Leptospira interrogans]
MNSDQQMRSLHELVNPSHSIDEKFVRDVQTVCDWIVADHRRNRTRARRRKLFTACCNKIAYLENQIKERDAVLEDLKTQTDAMAAYVADIKKSYGFKAVV